MKIGDYVRTISGKIYKIVDDDLGDYITVENEYNGTYKIDISNITKSSLDIIDLIEVGDYVNGHRVSCISNVTGNVYTDDINIIFKNIEDIKSIVTHEQFSSMEYRIGE